MSAASRVRYLPFTLVTTTLAQPSHLFAISEAPPQIDRTDGKAIVRGLKIFRTGTFKDSRGIQRTWTLEDLNKIVENYRALQSIFPNPPVRADHSTSVDKVKGHFTDTRVVDEFLVGDLVFTEPDGADKYERGTYRNRSIEVGPYETNGAAPTTLWPCMLGMAFVDISAVEGLFGRHQPPEDNPVTTFRIRGVETSNEADIQKYITELEARPPVGQSFRIAGADEIDFAKVQAHIVSLETQNATLETFKSEQLTAGRATFVKALVAGNKVSAAQTDELTEFAKGLTQEAFDAWSKTFEKAPTLFKNAVGTGDGNTNNDSQPTAAEQALADDREIVAMHRRTGTMSDDAIKATASYRRLVAADPTAAIV